MGLLRLLLACAVVVAHSGPLTLFGVKLMGGEMAVQSFYIISGFYMALILNDKYTGPGSYRLFLTNRGLRIMPLYWAMVLLTLLARMLKFIRDPVGPFAINASPAHFDPLSVALIILSNIIVFGQDTVMFLGLNPQGHLFFTSNYRLYQPQLFRFFFVDQSWTLAVELTFYLVAPLLVRRSVKVLLPIIAASLALRCFLYMGLGLSNDPWSYRFFPTELAFFLAGAVGYRMYKWYEPRLQKSILPIIVGGVVLAAAFGFEFIPPTKFAGQPSWTFLGRNVPLWDTRLALLKQWLFYLLVWLAVPLLFLWTRKNRFDRYIGELSYPVYLCHILVLNIVIYYMGRPRDARTSPFEPLVVLLGTLAMSVALYHAIVVPIDRWRSRRVKRAHHEEPQSQPQSEPVAAASRAQ